MTPLMLKANKGARHRKKRLGRGNASGTGTYAGRGLNGQRSRTGSSAKPGFEGGQTPIFRKMPKLKGFKNINRVKFQPVNVGQLNVFEDGSEIELMQLFERNLISHKGRPVKILGDGELTKKLTVKADRISASAKSKIEKAKGKAIELIATKTEEAEPKKVKASAKEAPAEEAAPKETEEASQK